MRIKPQHLGPALAILLWQAPAFAALGGDVRSVNADREMMQGQLLTTPMQQFDLHEITEVGLIVGKQDPQSSLTRLFHIWVPS